MKRNVNNNNSSSRLTRPVVKVETISSSSSSFEVLHAQTITEETTTTTINPCIDGYNKNVQKPHTLRLLKLIRDGTAEHASEAVQQLCEIASGKDSNSSSKRGSSSSSYSSCGSSSFTPVQLWDLLGRLQEHLTSNIWRTRTNAAMALEGIAKHIPISDQIDFLTMSIKTTTTAVAETPPPAELEPTTTSKTSTLSRSGTDTNEVNHSNITSLLLTIQDIHDALDNIRREGRLLYSSSGSCYDKVDEDSIQNFDRELMTTSTKDSGMDITSEEDATQNQMNNDFVERRVQLQRRIMAQRLGLSELCNIVDCEEKTSMVLPADCITSDDIFTSPTHTTISTDATRTKNRKKFLDQINNEKPMKHRKRIKKYSQQKLSDDAGIEPMPSTISTSGSVRALLIMEMERRLVQTTTNMNVNSSNSIISSSSSSHRSTQTLLASEFIYRMFDPCWYVRHGAILGIVSLLRAWKDTTLNNKKQNILLPSTDAEATTATTTTTPTFKMQGPEQKSLNDKDEDPRTPPTLVENGNYIDDVNLFGSWPHDILARCICVLILDRFGDFSGSNVHENLDANENTYHEESDGVVAPVREVAGQLLTLLVTMSPICIKYQVMDIFQKLLLSEDIIANTLTAEDWEVRHGALVALKFMSSFVLASKRLLPYSVDARNDFNSANSGNTALTPSTSTKNSSIGAELEWLNTVTHVATEVATKCLSDPSDDVKTVAAQILTQVIIGFHKTNNNSGILRETRLRNVPNAVWSTMKCVKSWSSSIVSLLTLFSVLLDSDCLTFWRSIALVEDADDTVTKENILDGSSGFKSVVTMVENLLDSDLLSVRLSSLRCISSLAKSFHVSMLSQDLCSTQLRHNIREAYSSFISRLFEMIYTTYDISECLNTHDTDIEDCSKNQRKVCHQVWRRLCDVVKIVVHDDGTDSALKSMEVTLIKRYFHIDRERTLFDPDVSSHVQAAEALAHFLWCTRTFDKISEPTEFALRVFFHSPWISQCEQACFLYRSLSNNFKKPLLPSLSVTLDVVTDNNDRPLVLQLNDDDLNCIMKDSSLAMLCDRCFLQFLSQLCDNCVCITHATKHVVYFFRESSQRTCTLQESSRIGRKPTTMNMRFEASIAGAAMKMGLPAKITPIVRALMTSLNNESSSPTRQFQTCLYLKEILMLLNNQQQYSNARTKVLSTLIDKAIQEVRTMDRNTMKPGSAVVELLIRSLGENETLEGIPPIWDRLNVLTYGFDATVFDVEDSLYLLRIVCRGLVCCHRATYHFVDCFVPVLVRYGCEHSKDTIRSCAASILEDLCGLMSEYVLQKTLPRVISYLTEQSQYHVYRSSAGHLMQKLVARTGKSICPFIRTLIPITLSLMTDPEIECTHIANNLFAVLVQFAPLVQKTSTETVSVSSSDGDFSQTVMDHLIFGNPLPSYPLPKDVEDSLRSGKIELRKYQLEGITWLRFLQAVKVNGALCDNMGLGKTLQALVGIAVAHAESNHKSNPCSLVVCPSTVVGHWTNEIQYRFPGKTIFRVLCLCGNKSSRQNLWKENLDRANIVVTSYSVLRSDVEMLQTIDWCYCVLDEGHLLKNPKTATSQSSRRIKCQHRLILTGTPIQNHVNELWATFDFLMPNFLGSSTLFTNDFAGPIARSQISNASASAIAEGMNKLKILHQKVLPFILRREKEQVLPELPPKTITTVKVPMSSVQATLYSNLRANPKVRNSLKVLSEALADKSQDLSDRDFTNNDVLKSVLALRLLCTHPLLVLSEEKLKESSGLWQSHAVSGKMLALAQLLREAGLYVDELSAADNDCSLLYCEDGEQEIDSFSSIVGTVRNEGAVFQLPMPENDCKCLIFAQFTRSLDILEELVFKRLMPSLRYLRLDGRVPAGSRNDIANRFNTDNTIRLLLLTTRVGGLGLNLTGANIVIFLELDYNPFADIQAMDRAHRIGQSKPVNVYRIVTASSIEENILELQERKVASSNAIVNTDNSTMFSMGTDRLLDVFTFQTATEGKNSSNVSADDFDLDGIIDNCAEDYSSLSVEYFLQSLG